MAKRILTQYIPEYDDYELPAELHLDYSKSKPNPFVARAKHAPALKKSVRANKTSVRSVGKPKIPAVKRHTITLNQADAAYLKSLDKSLSHAIRKLILMQRQVS